MGRPMTNISAMPATIAATLLAKPYVRVIEAPIASQARKAVAPIAVPATLRGDQRRALSAV
ncbi:hypothetical protein [Novosphingobium album (ex Liu et al. 2023)]|uniref:hypothetical protein n=1 Tax=Novosphingobium album (ex Liu et al. 2023) TaxID=3031130 RepID=UPI00319E13A1